MGERVLSRVIGGVLTRKKYKVVSEEFLTCFEKREVLSFDEIYHDGMADFVYKKLYRTKFFTC